jgi:hypothetical protein
MLGGLQPQERRTADGPAAAPASTLFGPDAVIGFDPTQASDSTWSYGMQTCGGSVSRSEPSLGNENHMALRATRDARAPSRSGNNSAVVLQLQTSDLLAGLRLAADAPPAAVGAHEEAVGSAGAGASQVCAAPSQQGLQPQCPQLTLDAQAAGTASTDDHQRRACAHREAHPAECLLCLAGGAGRGASQRGGDGPRGDDCTGAAVPAHQRRGGSGILPAAAQRTLAGPGALGPRSAARWCGKPLLKSTPISAGIPTVQPWRLLHSRPVQRHMRYVACGGVPLRPVLAALNHTP